MVFEEYTPNFLISKLLSMNLRKATTYASQFWHSEARAENLIDEEVILRIIVERF